MNRINTSMERKVTMIMAGSNHVIKDDNSYVVLRCEDSPYLPADLNISPTWEKDKKFQYSGNMGIEDYKLYLKDLSVFCDRGFPEIGNVVPKLFEISYGITNACYENINIPLIYTGGMIIGEGYLKDYDKGMICSGRYYDPLYCYETLLELIFQDGRLVTEIDHSKAMRRIRKNLDLGLRSLESERDVKCIRHFINTSFIGDYEHPGKNKKKKRFHINNYIKKLRKSKTENPQ